VATEEHYFDEKLKKRYHKGCFAGICPVCDLPVSKRKKHVKKGKAFFHPACAGKHKRSNPEEWEEPEEERGTAWNDFAAAVEELARQGTRWGKRSMDAIMADIERRLAELGEVQNPGRPTKEFWDKVYPKVLKHYKKKYGKKEAEERARAVTGSIWHHKMRPGTKRKFESIRRKREATNPKEVWAEERENVSPVLVAAAPFMHEGYKKAEADLKRAGEAAGRTAEGAARSGADITGRGMIWAGEGLQRAAQRRTNPSPMSYPYSTSERAPFLPFRDNPGPYRCDVCKQVIDFSKEEVIIADNMLKHLKCMTEEEIDRLPTVKRNPGVIETLTHRGNLQRWAAGGETAEENPRKKRKMVEVVRYTIKDDLGRTYADREGTEDEARREARSLSDQYGRKMHLIFLEEVLERAGATADEVAKALR
jgi:hypothetical protein